MNSRSALHQNVKSFVSVMIAGCDLILLNLILASQLFAYPLHLKQRGNGFRLNHGLWVRNIPSNSFTFEEMVYLNSQGMKFKALRSWHFCHINGHLSFFVLLDERFLQ
jgi:hypothetical protein